MTTDQKHGHAEEMEFAAFAERHSELITRICYMYASGRDHFNDLRQETLINLWRGFARFRGQAKESTWVYRTTINTCISHYRRNRRHDSTLSIDDITAAGSDPDDAADSRRTELLTELYDLINTLEPLDKALIMLWLDERPYDEISEITGLVRNTVASRLHRIRLTLTRKMNPPK